MTDVVVIWLTRLPSHGRETAHALKSMKATRTIPIVFVDGEPEKIEKCRAKVPGATYTTTSRLAAVLKGLGRMPATSSPRTPKSRSRDRRR